MSWDPGYERPEPDEGRYGPRDWDEVDWADIASEAELELIQTGIQEQSEDRVRTYLSTYGDEVWARVRWVSQEAEWLRDGGHPEAALALAAVAAELTIRFLILRPLLGGIIFSDALAEQVAARVASGHAKGDRDMLPFISHHWDLKIDAIDMASGRPLLAYLQRVLWVRRDGVIHRGERPSIEEADLACEAVALLRDQVVAPLARRLDLKWPDGRWGDERDAKSPFP